MAVKRNCHIVSKTCCGKRPMSWLHVHICDLSWPELAPCQAPQMDETSPLILAPWKGCVFQNQLPPMWQLAKDKKRFGHPLQKKKLNLAILFCPQIFCTMVM
eukprot:1332000-Amphidinium_carterae.4